MFLIFAKGTILPWAVTSADNKSQFKSNNAENVKFVSEKAIEFNELNEFHNQT